MRVALAPLLGDKFVPTPIDKDNTPPVTSPDPVVTAEMLAMIVEVRVTLAPIYALTTPPVTRPRLEEVVEMLKMILTQ